MPLINSKVELQHVNLCGGTNYRDLTIVDASHNPSELRYALLSGCRLWHIQARFENSRSMELVVCNWERGLRYVAHASYPDSPATRHHIGSHQMLIPYVKEWLENLWDSKSLYGEYRAGRFVCPQLEIYGQSE